MKPIFRGILIMKFTENSENVNMDNLREYLKQNNLYNEESNKKKFLIFAIKALKNYIE